MDEKNQKTDFTHEYIMQLCTLPISELKKDYSMLLNAISIRASYLEPVSIQTLFELTDNEMNDENVIQAMKNGKAIIADATARKKLELALNEGNLKAIDYFMNVNGAKQPERQYQFNYNQKGDEDWENLKKNSDFN